MPKCVNNQLTLPHSQRNFFNSLQVFNSLNEVDVDYQFLSQLIVNCQQVERCTLMSTYY